MMFPECGRSGLNALARRWLIFWRIILHFVDGADGCGAAKRGKSSLTSIHRLS